MKKFFFILVSFFASFHTAFADGENILGLDDTTLRTGDIRTDDIPVVIANIIKFIILSAGTISVFMLIFFAVKMQLNSGITGDSSGVDRAKKWMIACMVGFVISVSAWFIMDRIIDILQITTR